MTMDSKEYNKIKDLTYIEYCDYLQKKYGIPKGPFFNSSWNKNPKITRTNEGLITHHKFEDHACKLSTREFAMNSPYDWQLPKALVYCDYLEHLLLHVMICEQALKNGLASGSIGIGGIVAYLVPELNDFYSGWVTKQPWRAICLNKVAKDKDAYLTILKRFKTNCRDYPGYTDDCLLSCYNEQYGLWSSSKNKKIYKEIFEL